MSAMKRLFQLMAEKNASDIFLSVGAPINIKINGVAMPINQQIMDSNTVRGLLHEVIDDKQKKEYEGTLELNTAYTLQGVGTFRISAFRQKGAPAVVVRYIPATIPPLDTLGLPPVLKDIILEKRGLILMVGATGSGKSTTLAAMLDFRNGQKTGHIFTLEDPVEFIFQNKKSIVNQREVGTDTLDMRVGLKNALRQAPDCILIGEVRDRENMTAAIQYAQSGHLCLATLHANNSYHAMNRIISFYPLETRPALLQDLSSTLKCVISQRLVKNVRGTQSAAVEIMLNSRYMA
ncbi:MAG: PilT/PilU family type 4a pilus ATPase, partial [Betaproteobacteria bacterium]